MNTPEKCPKCGCSQFVDITDGREFICFTLIAKDETLYEGNQCLKTQRDQLAERVRALEAWKESAMAVEREWDPNQLAAMLGGQLGESQRAVIQREVPVLVERVKQLELSYAECAEQREHDLRRRLEDMRKQRDAFQSVATDPHALWSNWLRGDIQLPAGIGDIRECSEKMKRFRSRWLATHQELRKAEDYIELLKSEKSC